MFIAIFMFSAHLTHLQNSPQTAQNVEAEKRMRKQKEMFDLSLNQKVCCRITAIPLLTSVVVFNLYSLLRSMLPITYNVQFQGWLRINSS